MSDMFFWIRKDLADFYEAVKLLSDSINHSQIDWRDEKYRELSEKIQVVAVSSAQVVQAGTDCEVALKAFERVAQEE